MHGTFFFSFFSFLFLFFLFTAYLQTTTTTKLCHDDNNTHRPQDMKGGNGDEETGPKRRNRVSSFVPLVHFCFSFFLIRFTIRTRDASCVLGLFFFITTSNNGLEMCQNASQYSLPPYLPWQARGAQDMSKHVSRSPPFFPTSCFISSFLFISTKLKTCLRLLLRFLLCLPMSFHYF